MAALRMVVITGATVVAVKAEAPNSYSYQTTGGNPDGFARLDTSAGTWWSVLYTVNPANISDLGLTAGETYTFQWDMRSSATEPCRRLESRKWSRCRRE